VRVLPDTTFPCVCVQSELLQLHRDALYYVLTWRRVAFTRLGNGNEKKHFL